MNAAERARGVLWRWTEMRREDPDDDWAGTVLTGAIDAAARTAVLPAEEIAAWRTIAAGGSIPPPAADAQALDAHLAALLRRVRPLGRGTRPDPADGMDVFTGAIDALRDTGLLDDAGHDAWRGRAIGAWAPWLDEETTARVVHADLVAISVPPTTPKEEAEDERRRAEHAEVMRRGELVRVLPATTVTRDAGGTAVTAAVARTDCTELHFHAVGPPWTADMPERSVLDRLPASGAPPELRDDVGTSYRAVRDRPVSASSHGGGEDQPMAVTGSWRYQPAIPPQATVLTATSGETRWTLRSGAATI